MTSIYSAEFDSIARLYADDYNEFAVFVAPDDSLWFGSMIYCECGCSEWDTDLLTKFTDFAEFVRQLTTWARDNDCDDTSGVILAVANRFDADHRAKVADARAKVEEIRNDLVTVNALINSLYKRRSRISMALDVAHIELNKLTD